MPASIVDSPRYIALPPLALQSSDEDASTKPWPLQAFWPLQALVVLLQALCPLQALAPVQCTPAAKAVDNASLVVLATGLLGTRIGLSQTEQFRVRADSVTGFDVVAAHFPAGVASLGYLRRR